MAWPGSKDFTYQTSMLSPNYPVVTTSWSQDSVQVGTTITGTPYLCDYSAYNLFDLYSRLLRISLGETNV